MKQLISLKWAALAVCLLMFTSCGGEIDPPVDTVAVESVTLEPATLSLVKGTTETLKATVLPEEATNKDVTWTSSDNTVATVKDGEVTAIKKGKATITVTAGNGKFKDECEVTVTETEVNVTGVTLDKDEITLAVNGTETLVATVLPAEATNKNVTWKSSNDSVATVEDGVVTGVKDGTATITVKTENGGYEAACKVTVTKDAVGVTGVRLDKTEFMLLTGTLETVKAIIEPSNATNKRLTWSVSDENREFVFTSVDDEEGVIVVYGVAEGHVTITVKTEDGGYEAACEVTVSKPHVPATSVTLDYTTLTIKVNKTGTLVETVLPADATNKNVTWRSSNSSVASVAGGVVTGLKPGNATITVRTEDGDHEASCEVTVDAGTTITTPTHARSNQVWRIGSQIWSDAINIPACNKTGFNGGLAGSEVSDCRNNGQYGYLYSWLYVNNNAANLCPDGWRVPTKDDFIALDIELGGSGGINQRDAALRAEYESRWGIEYGGYVDNHGSLKYTDTEAYYWSQTISTPGVSQYAYRLIVFSGNNNINPQDKMGNTYNGHAVRCVKDDE